MDIISSIGYIKDTGTPKGLGVFSSRAISSGEVIEVCPVIVLNTAFKDLPTELQRVVFSWATLAKESSPFAVALGYGSMYNHSNPANVRYDAMPSIRCMRFVAARDIEPHQELTVNYDAEGGGIVAGEELWFETMRVKPWVDP